jgi:hypothetical protein
MTDKLIVIKPYWQEGSWVLDKKSEKVVLPEGIAALIDDLVKDIANAREGFRLVLSPAPFQGYQAELTSAGFWYRDYGREGQGCVCPALFDCFETAPEAVYMKAEESQQGIAATIEPEEVTALRNRVEELEKIVYRLTMENELLKSGDVQEDPPAGGGGRYWVAGESQDE